MDDELLPLPLPDHPGFSDEEELAVGARLQEDWEVSVTRDHFVCQTCERSEGGRSRGSRSRCGGWRGSCSWSCGRASEQSWWSARRSSNRQLRAGRRRVRRGGA